MSACVTLSNELSEEIHMLRKQNTLLGRGAQVESRRVRTTLCHVAHSLQFYGNEVNFQVGSGQSSCSTHTWSGPGSFLVAQAPLSAMKDSSAKDPGRLVLSSSLLAPPKLVSLEGSTLFFIRTSCWKTAPASGYCHAWPRWVVSVSGPLTVPDEELKQKSR